MIRDALTHLELTDAPIFSLGLFFGMFLFVCLFTALRNGERGRAASQLPLEDGTLDPTTTPSTRGA